MYHADWSFSNTLTEETATTIQVDAKDGGINYLVLDYETDTFGFVARAKTLANNPTWLREFGTRDVDGDGTLDGYFTVNMGSLNPLEGGETAKPVTINVFIWKNEGAGGNRWTSTTNASGVISGSAYTDVHAAGYWAWTGTAIGTRPTGVGYQIRLVKLELTFASNNSTMVDDSSVIMKSVTIGGTTYSDFTFSKADNRILFNIGSTVVNQPEVGIDYVYTDGLSATWLGFDIFLSGKFTTSFTPTLKVTITQPDGTTATAEQITDFD